MKPIIRIGFKSGAGLLNPNHLMYAEFNYATDESVLHLSNGGIRNFKGSAKQIERQLLDAFQPEPVPEAQDDETPFDEYAETPKEAVLKLLANRPDEIFSTRYIGSQMGISTERARRAAQGLAQAALIHTVDVDGRIYYSFNLPGQVSNKSESDNAQ